MSHEARVVRSSNQKDVDGEVGRAYARATRLEMARMAITTSEPELKGELELVGG